MLVTIRTPEEHEAWEDFERGNLFGPWAVRAADAMDVLVEQNKFWRENQVGMGAGKHGSGDGVKEASMPYEVLLLKLKEDPDFLNDDDAWYKWLRTQPNLRTYDYGKTGSKTVRVHI